MRYVLLLAILIAGFAGLTQQTDQQYNQSLGEIPAQEAAYLRSLPEFTLDPHRAASRDLPSIVNNSLKPYFRPVFQQDGYSCGQAALVSYNFTYEMNYKRGVPGNVPQNQYPTHFTWNFMNAGNYYGGVSFYHSMEILRHCGNPDVQMYGGMAHGGQLRWMSGYNDYYESMKNRIVQAYKIYVGNEEGLNTLKNWLANHGTGDSVGGVASYYANHPSWPNLQVLPSGTPEAGSSVVLGYSSSSHAMTIVGYHDSICWDYNNDGQYTNDIDINNDGVVNMRDWEIGGVRMVNSYGGVPNWADTGFAYMMYKTLADPYGNGGIWDNSVNILKVKDNVAPQLTAKVLLKHTSRETIKVNAGLALDINATVPEIILDFPIFDFQGNNYYMQGGGTEDDKTIEFGLDLTPLLSYITSGQQAKFFIRVLEDDPNNWALGELLAFSIMDYTSGVQEIASQNCPITITQNGLILDAVVHTPNFDKPEIVDNTLPPAPANTYYQHQLTATDGTPPYFWTLKMNYTENSSSQSFSSNHPNTLTPSNNNNGLAMLPLNFEFPFYGTYYDTLYVHTDGFIQFDEQSYIWPYFQDRGMLFLKTKVIAPFMADLFLYANDGMFYDMGDDYVSIRWKASQNTYPGSTNMNFSVTIFESGDIEFNYGTMHFQNDMLWDVGTSKGDCYDYQYASVNDSSGINEDYFVEFLTNSFPDGMTLSEEGLFYGTPPHEYYGIPITFRAHDNNGIFTDKLLYFSSGGLLIEGTVFSGDDEVIEYGESAVLSIEVTNTMDEAINDADMLIRIADEYFMLTDSTEQLGSLTPGQTRSYPDAFSFDVSSQVENNTDLIIQCIIEDNDSTYNSLLAYVAFAPEVLYTSHIVQDGDDNILDPGETSDIDVIIKNNGGTDVQNLNIQLQTNDTYLTINAASAQLDNMDPGDIDTLTYNITASPDAPVGHLAELVLDISGSNMYVTSDSLDLRIGLTLEDFETGDFNLFAWGFSGQRDWLISGDAYEGSYSARSGNITHDQYSSLIIDIDVMNEGEVKFYRKVSCERDTVNQNYDYLKFSIDGVELDRWDGERNWEEEAYAVNAGKHRLRWDYIKDGSVSSGMDAAWIDHIQFPSCFDISHQLNVSPENLDFALQPGQTDMQLLNIENLTEGLMDFNLITANSSQGDLGGRSILGSHITCDLDHFYTGEEIEWELSVYNASPDDEWLRDIFITFPEGLKILDAGSFVGGSLGNLDPDITTGNGITIHWHGENGNGWGVIKGGETAVAAINLIPDADYTTNALLEYEVQGDIYGEEPHIIYGEIFMENRGEIINWISLDTSEGSLAYNQSTNIQVSVDAAALDDGTYYCEIVLHDNFQNEYIVPVSLLVDTYLDIGKLGSSDLNKDLRVFPNPSSGAFHIQLEEEYEVTSSIQIYQSDGKLIWEKHVSGTGLDLIWDGKDQDGKEAEPGTYIIQVITDKYTYQRKLLKF